MSKNLDELGLKSIFSEYDLFFIDIWGVVHNGIKLYENAIKVLNELSNNEKKFILLTNAPRPNLTVINTLKKMGLNNFSDTVFTSGEASKRYLLKNFNNKKFFHLGPPRDFDLFKTFEDNKVLNIDDSDYLLCSGLFEDHEDDLGYYKTLLSKHITKKMICTNPDLIVDRGDKREYCAGSIAKSFEEINGEVIYFGKPYPPVYEIAADVNNKKILCIGDNLNTDIKGANIQNFDSLLITGGIHRQEISKLSINKLLKNYETKINYFQKELKW
ncbi:TIGR01459 family HAD-type hydrolase [Candidatus Pelagibacter sp.]|nr:TIGR01459 family HAD-type hydrolase [Candidatus Pelagibacter sp.]